MKVEVFGYQIIVRKKKIFAAPIPQKSKKKTKPRPNYCLHKEKRMYQERQAKDAAKRQMKKYPGIHLRAYMCMFCNAWHLTKQYRNKW